MQPGVSVRAVATCAAKLCSCAAVVAETVVNGARPAHQYSPSRQTAEGKDVAGKGRPVSGLTTLMQISLRVRGLEYSGATDGYNSKARK